MSTRELAFAALGVVLGFVAFSMIGPANESDCCARVAAGVREKVGDKLGSTAVAVGDALNLWPKTPALLRAFGA